MLTGVTGHWLAQLREQCGAVREGTVHRHDACMPCWWRSLNTEAGWWRRVVGVFRVWVLGLRVKVVVEFGVYSVRSVFSVFGLGF
jgi:hypothetical protein